MVFVRLIREWRGGEGERKMVRGDIEREREKRGFEALKITPALVTKKVCFRAAAPPSVLHTCSPARFHRVLRTSFRFDFLLQAKRNPT